MAETRKLAAILAADVVGYSRLVGADEDGTVARIRALRSELIDPAIASNRGRIVKTTGDGILIEFASVVDAVRCAIEVQKSMAQRNAKLGEDRRIDFRVGIHLGDVIVRSGRRSDGRRRQYRGAIGGDRQARCHLPVRRRLSPSARQDSGGIYRSRRQGVEEHRAADAGLCRSGK